MLYIVATPIGNLEDITFRAIRVLREVDLIACEDTRITQKLLARYQIKTPIVSYHQHTKLEKIDFLIEQLISGKDIALVSDAGTPGIADPGQILIYRALKNKIKVISIPGPSALTAALSVAGFNTDKFLFLGYLPKKKGRQSLLASLTSRQFNYPIVIYESPHRIKKTLNDLRLAIGDMPVIVARELTKKFETVYRGKISEVLPKVKEKGEFVIIIQNAKIKNQNEN